MTPSPHIGPQERADAIRERVSHIARGCRAHTSHQPDVYLNDIDMYLDGFVEQNERLTQNVIDCNARSRALAEKVIGLEEQLEAERERAENFRLRILKLATWYGHDEEAALGESNPSSSHTAIPTDAGITTPAEQTTAAVANPNPELGGARYINGAWEPQCPYGDMCSRCDAIGYCERVASSPASGSIAPSDGYVECACGCRNSVTKGCAWRRCDNCSAVLNPSEVSNQEHAPAINPTEGEEATK